MNQINYRIDKNTIVLQKANFGLITPIPKVEKKFLAQQTLFYFSSNHKSQKEQ